MVFWTAFLLAQATTRPLGLRVIMVFWTAFLLAQATTAETLGDIVYGKVRAAPVKSGELLGPSGRAICWERRARASAASRAA